MHKNLKDLLRERGLNAARLAGLMKVNRATTHRWVHSGVPAERVPDVERMTGIPRAWIRPDLFGPESFKPPENNGSH